MYNVLMKTIIPILLILIMLTGCSAAPAAHGYKEYVISLEGDGYEIPATVCMPAGDDPHPAVIMLHGTASNRDEVNGAYKKAAEIMAEKYGVATIRIDFAGFGDSKADPLLYNFETAVNDAAVAADYMAGQKSISDNNIGVMGFSQGGTIALLASARRSDVFRSVVTWSGAPDLTVAGIVNDVDYEFAKKNGYFNMKFDFTDKTVKTSLKWCEDVYDTDVLGEFAKGYNGPVLAIAGSSDTTVDPKWSRRIVDASHDPRSELLIIDGADHTFNVFTENDMSSLSKAIDATGDYFSDTLAISQ